MREVSYHVPVVLPRYYVFGLDDFGLGVSVSLIFHSIGLGDLGLDRWYIF